MSYKTIVKEIDDEYKLKRKRAEFLADARYNDMLKKHPELDKADTELRITMRKYGFGEVQKKDVENAKLELGKAFTRLNINKKINTPQYECNICNDTGKTEYGRCKCFMQEVYSRLYSESSIYNTAFNQTFETFDLSLFPDDIPEGYKLSQKEIMSRVLKQALEYTKNFPNYEKENILLLGPAGVGKTFLANAIAKSVLDKGFTVLSTNAFGLFERLSDRLNGIEVDLNHIREADLLFIDDLGMEPIFNNFTIEYLFEIINHRLKRCKPTIITSNLSTNEIRDRYTERISSRLFDRLHSVVIYLPGKDLRLIKR